MSKIVPIEKIAIDENDIISVKPKNERFDMIYRAAMGVRWDNDRGCLFYKSPIKQENDVLNFYNFILNAVLDEYGKTLIIDNKTIFVNIDEKIKAKLINYNSF